MNGKIKGSIGLMLTTIIWGSAFVAQSVGMDHIGPFTFQTVRCLLAVISLFLVVCIRDLLRRKKRGIFSQFADKKLWKAGILCGIPLFLASNFQQIGLVDTEAGKSAFLTAMYIVIVPIISIFIGKKPSKMIPISALLAVAGLYCLSCIGVTSINKGDFFLLGGALFFAVQIILIDLFAGDADPLLLNLVQCLICCVLSALIMVFTESPTLQAIYDCRLPLAYAGILSMGFAYSMQIVGQKYLEPSAASLIMSLESVFAVLFGWLILGDTLTFWETVGCILVFLAVVLSQIPVKEPLELPKQVKKNSTIL